MSQVDLVSKHFLQLPALHLGKWAALDDADFVPFCCFGVLIVCVELLRTLDDFLETWVWNTGGGFDDDGLVHLDRLDDANTGLANVMNGGI